MDDIFGDLFGEEQPTKRQVESRSSDDEADLNFKKKRKVEEPKDSAIVPVDDEMADFLVASESSSGSSSDSDSSDSDSAASIRSNQQPRQRAKPKTQFDAVLDRMKKTRRTKGAVSADTSDELVSTMLRYAEQDAALLAANQPAIKKITLLPMVSDFVYRNREAFVDAGGLKALYEWLRLLPDGSLPNLTLRSSILQFLGHLLPAISIDSLKESRVGWAVNDLFHHDSEIPENKRSAYGLISTWLLSCTKKDGNGVRKATEDDMRRTQRLHNKREGSENRTFDKVENGPLRRANIPRPIAEEFRMQPVSKIEPVEKKIDSETAIGRLMKKF